MARQITISLSDSDAKELERAAKHEDLTAEQLVDQLVQDRFEYERWFVREVQKGIESAERGELIDHKELFDRLRNEISARKAAAE